MAELFIGLMSGTSMDGIDAVLVDFDGPAPDRLRVRAHVHRAFGPELAAELFALNRPGGADELHRAALAANALARLSADAVHEVLTRGELAGGQVRAIGSHGQTVRHRPGEFDGVGYTLQLNNPALLAELTGIDVAADFRSRDVAAGGQGAPLVPAFHRAVFGRPDTTIAVLNLGGIANLTVLGADGTTLGFDCGPANVLMDHWCRQHTSQPFDAEGRWAASGRIVPALLASMQTDAYFLAAPPKSTGRDHFHREWLMAWPGVASATPVDVQATLAELTATVCADDLRRAAPTASELLVCGGGALNRHLIDRLRALLPGCRVRPTDEAGLPATQVEACAFAWLARALCRREPGNLVAVTGALGPRLLGALYPGNRPA